MTETTLIAGVIQELEDMIKLIEAKKAHFRAVEDLKKVALADNVIKQLRWTIKDLKHTPIIKPW